MNKYIKTSYREFIKENLNSSTGINDLKKRAGTWSPKPLSIIRNDRICVFRETLRDIFQIANVKYVNLDVMSQGTGLKFLNNLTFISGKEDGFSKSDLTRLEDIFKEFYGKGGFVDMVLSVDGREIILEFDSKYPMSLYSDFPTGKSNPQGGSIWNPDF